MNTPRRPARFRPARAGHVLVKELIHTLRDPRMRAMIFVMPLVQLLVFGYAVTTDVRRAATAAWDLDNSPASRELLDRFAHSGYFTIVARVDTPHAAADLLDRGVVRAVLHINHGFAADLHAGRTAPLQVILDGSDSNTAGILLEYSTRIAAELSGEIAVRRASLAGRSPPGPPALDLAVRPWFNEDLSSRNFYVPGVIAMLVMLVTLMLTSMAIVREKESGTIEQVLVTPITPAEFIVGKTLPFAAIGMVNVALISAVAVFWFAVPLRGNLLLLLGAAGLYLMSSLGIGLLISTISHTQQQAMMTTFLFYMPAMLLSGFMFPIANMPPVIQALTLANPLRHFLVIVRAVFLKGVGADILWPQMGALAILGGLTLAAAVLRFQKRLA